MRPSPLLLIVLSAPAAAQSYEVTHFDNPGAPSFGNSVDASGTRAILGSADGAWIAERNGSGRWSLTTELAPVDGVSAVQFGRAVALDGDRAVVGAPANSASSADSGSIYVFQRSDGGNWKSDGKLFLSSPIATADFGRAVDLDGDRIAVGAPGAPSPFGPENTGVVHVFDREPSGWVLDATLGVPGLAGGTRFGLDVALDGDRLIAGAPFGGGAGAAYVFEREPSGNWVQSDVLTPSDGAALDWFGLSVAIDGSRAAVGGPLHDGFAFQGGAVWAYTRQSNGSWVETQKLGHPGLTGGDRLGEDLALSGGQLLAGAPGFDVGGIFATGSAQQWKLSGEGAWTWIEVIAPIDPGSSQYSGSAVALDGGWVVLGGPGAGTGGGQLVDVLYSYPASGATPPEGYGKGTEGCDGLQTLEVSLPPLVGTSELEVLTLNAPPDVTGLGLIGLEQDGIGADPLGLGVLLHVGLLDGPPPLLISAKSDGQGIGFVSAPIPPSASLAGAKLFAQTIWVDPGCGANPSGLSSSAGLAFSIAEP